MTERCERRGQFGSGGISVPAWLFGLWEAWIKRRKHREYRAFLEQSQWWSPEELAAYQRGALNKLLWHAYENVPFWRARLKSAGIEPGDIQSLDDMRRIPIVEKEEIRQHKDQMIADNWRGRTWTKATGGSTGVPLAFDYSPESFDWRVACSRRGYSWAGGCEIGKKQAYIWGVAIGKLSLLHGLKEGLHHFILNQKYFNCFDFDAKRMDACVRQMNQWRPEYIIGYTNPLYELARYIQEGGHLGFAPRAVLCAAEKVYPYQREVIERVFGCAAFNTYGSREFMLIASECEEHGGLHVSMENLIVEVIKDDGLPAKGGETGDLVITDLHNYGMPFIRYRIGDMAEASECVCTCGRGLMLLADVVGRSLDVIRTPEGKTVPGEFFPHLMKEFDGIEQFQVIQTQLDHLQVKIVKNDLFTAQDLHFMREQIVAMVGSLMVLEFDFVQSIPLTKTGKYRVTVSKFGGSDASVALAFGSESEDQGGV
jgi:phenylacetate-CoA ligase